MTREFVTLPREVVELAIEAIGDAKHKIEFDAIDALIAALKQPKNHVPDAGNMAPAGWKLVPSDATHQWAENLADRGMRISSLASAISDMLAAAPQPPTTEDFSVDQPQSEQPAMTPIAQRKLDSLLAEGYTISGYSIYHERKHQHGFVTGAGLVGWWKPEGVEHVQPLGEQKLFAWISPRALEWGTRQSEKVVKLACKAQPEYDFTEPLYTRPQPKREPLTDEEINKLCPQFDDPMRREMWIIGFKAAHNIK